jgi:putative redox protein
MEFKMKENGFVTQVEYGELHISGNEEFGFRPYQLLVSSIAVCSGGVLRKILEKQRVVIDDISITADVTRNEEIPQEIQRIHLHFVLKGQKLVEEKIEKALMLTRKHCSMVQSVKDSIDVTESFNIISAQ